MCILAISSVSVRSLQILSFIVPIFGWNVPLIFPIFLKRSLLWLLLLSRFSHVQPHRWQPTRLPHPWDSPGKNTGMGCHFLLQSTKVKSESEVSQSCPTLSDHMDCPTRLLCPWDFPGKRPIANPGYHLWDFDQLAKGERSNHSLLLQTGDSNDPFHGFH